MDVIANRAEAAVLKAGEIITGTKPDQSRLKMKGAGNFVTHVDYQVQNFLQKELQEIIPGSNIITEESADNLYDFSGPTWILDPVDGTTNLMKGLNFSCISLALHVDKTPVLAFIYNPFARELFSAQAGKGAFLNGEAIHVSECSELKECLLGFGTTPYERGDSARTFGLVENVFKKCLEIRRSGSAALDIAYVACGRFDGFFELKLQPWDYAAGILILREAGGRIGNWEGEDPSVLHPDSILATNGIIHQQMADMVR